MACCCYTKLNELPKTDLAEPCVLWKLQEQSPNLNNHSTFLGVFDFILWILILPGLRKVPCFVDVELQDHTFLILMEICTEIALI